MSARLPGFATPEATRSRRARFPAWAHGYGPLGSTGLTVSRLGFGCYRVDDETPDHHEALLKALRAGVNLIDTSTNYTDGESEQLVGHVLAEAAASGDVNREGVVVVSKIGYVQGRNLALAQSREREGRPFPEMVKYMQGCWHCVHPEFLADQIDRSLARLGLETLDVCLLHNPEYFLSDARKHGNTNLGQIRDEFYRRLGEAFAFLEKKVEEGHIGAYGVSSNTCCSHADDAEATSVARMIEVARGAGGPQNHFRVLQMPLNLYESGGARTHNTGPSQKKTALEEAHDHQLGVLVNRPLNAFSGERLIRLADFVSPGQKPLDFKALLASVGALEERYRREFAASVHAGPDALPSDEYLRWGEELKDLPAHLESWEHWDQIEGQVIAPQVHQVLFVLDQAFAGPDVARWHVFRGSYMDELVKLMQACRELGAAKSQTTSDAISAAIDPLLPGERRKESLSRKALWTLESTPGVTSVLVGMRRPAYVDDALATLAWAPLDKSVAVYERIGKGV